MDLDSIKNRIRPELESIFGMTMANLILTKAKMKTASEAKDPNNSEGCRLFVECLRRDDMLIGMWGASQVDEKATQWIRYIGEN